MQLDEAKHIHVVTELFGQAADGHGLHATRIGHAASMVSAQQQGTRARAANCAPSWSEMLSGTASRLASGAVWKLCQVPLPSALPRSVLVQAYTHQHCCAALCLRQMHAKTQSIQLSSCGVSARPAALHQPPKPRMQRSDCEQRQRIQLRRSVHLARSRRLTGQAPRAARPPGAPRQARTPPQSPVLPSMYHLFISKLIWPCDAACSASFLSC